MHSLLCVKRTSQRQPTEYTYQLLFLSIVCQVACGGEEESNLQLCGCTSPEASVWSPCVRRPGQVSVSVCSDISKPLRALLQCKWVPVSCLLADLYITQKPHQCRWPFMIEGELNSELLPGPQRLLAQWSHVNMAQEKGEQREWALFAGIS